MPNISIVWKFVIWSVILIGLVGYTGYVAIWNNQPAFSGGTPDFNYWQSKYKDIAYDVAPDSSSKEAASSLTVAVTQYTIQQFPFTESDGTEQQRVDRCESCHAGVENPNMTAENIIKSIDHVTLTADQVGKYLEDPAHAETLKAVYTLGVHPGRGLYETLTPVTIIKSTDNVDVSPSQVAGYLAGHPATQAAVYSQLGLTGTVAPATLATAQKIVYQNGVIKDNNLEWAYVVGDESDKTAHDRAAEDDHVVSAHPFATYGCTTCHYGSGRELVEAKAHGDSEFWLQPMLPYKYQQAACAQCHERFDPKTFAAAYLPEMTTINRGQQLFKQNACWGCHKIEGYSKGNVGPELTIEGRIATYLSIDHQLWDPRYKVNNCVMPYFFSRKIENNSSDSGLPQEILDSYGHVVLGKDGKPMDPSLYPHASVDSPDTTDTLVDHGYIPDPVRQADVDALVTYITSQTGLNYSQDRSGHLMRLTGYNSSQPDTVAVTAAEGKVLFEKSGCYSCHYLGDPNHPTNGHGGVAGPNLSWEGSRHSQQWIIAHYLNPQYFVPKSIMPVFPFSDSQRAALALYDSSFIPKGAKAVSSDQDMPSSALIADDIVVPQVRYMMR